MESDSWNVAQQIFISKKRRLILHSWGTLGRKVASWIETKAMWRLFSLGREKIIVEVKRNQLPPTVKQKTPHFYKHEGGIVLLRNVGSELQDHDGVTSQKRVRFLFAAARTSNLTSQCEDRRTRNSQSLPKIGDTRCLKLVEDLSHFLRSRQFVSLPTYSKYFSCSGTFPGLQRVGLLCSWDRK